MGGSVPSPPDPNQAAIAGVTQDAANFPLTWQINQLAQQGGHQVINGVDYDFTGLGNADQQNVLSDQAAQALLDIQDNYGSAYIQQRLADLQQSDPTGYAARQQLFDKILADSKDNPDRPLATDTQDQVNQMLQTSGHLDEQGLQEVQQGTRANQVAHGIYLGNAPASEEASNVVNASDALKTQQQQQASSYLQSGVSPEDVAYRRIQQSLSNLGAFVNNQTPTAQFASLSAAGNGAAPFNPTNYQNPASLNPNAAANGLNNANSIYGQQLQFNQNQSNPWLTGLATGANAAGAYLNWANAGNAGGSFLNQYQTNPGNLASSPSPVPDY